MDHQIGKNPQWLGDHRPLERLDALKERAKIFRRSRENDLEFRLHRLGLVGCKATG